jgi:diguanylate cyclase (GGDEF)-like protein/PAS domain S-box-containing protein
MEQQRARTCRPSRTGWFLAAMAAGNATYYVLPGDFTKVALGGTLTLLSSLVILLGVRRYRPVRALAWYLLAASQLSRACGYGTVLFTEIVLHRSSMPPSAMDAFFVAAYPLMAAGLVVLARSRTPRRDLAGALDTAMVTISIGMLSWVFLVVPHFHIDLPVVTLLTSVGYPLMDLVLVAIATRLFFDRAPRPPAFFLLVSGLVLLLVANTVYGVGRTYGTWQLGNATDLIWGLAYTCLGLAALHPSMRMLAAPAPVGLPRLSRTRFVVLLTLDSLLAPTVLALGHARGYRVDLVVVAASSVALFVIALLRMGGVANRVRETLHQNEWWARRETTLRKAAAALVIASTPDEICAAAVDAARALTGPAATVVRFITDPDALGWLPAALRASFRQGAVNLTGDRAEDVCRNLELPSCPVLLLAPVWTHGELVGVLVVGGTESEPATVTSALEMLGSQVALALESVALTESLHRQQSDERFRRLVRNASDVITVTDRDLVVVYQTPSAERVLGHAPDELVGTGVLELIHPEDRSRVETVVAGAGGDPHAESALECRIRHRDGRYLLAETIVTVTDDDISGYVFTTRDITERQALEDQLKHQAFHDSLTGLANRALFIDRMHHALARRRLADAPLAVLFLDLDDFKTINDSLGHVAGDRLLTEVAARLRQCLRPSDTPARLGGDEFAILLEDLGDETEATNVAERVLAALQPPFTVDGQEVVARASIGIAIADLDRIPRGDDLLRDAEAAMYTAKNQSKGGYACFAPSMHEALLRKLELTAQMRGAVERREFLVHYQPIVELATGEITGVEALVRWQHPTRGLVSPVEFIPLAEETGLIVPIGRWVLEQACAQGARWRREFGRTLEINVNLSVRQMQDSLFVRQVGEILADTGMEPGALTLEITESFLADDNETTSHRLAELKRLGVRLAIDDFGTGYSSLSRLQQFPIDTLKIPKPFVDGLLRGSDHSALARAIADLAGRLSMDVVAEGIEEYAQWQELRSFACKFGQGFYFAKPVDSATIDGLLSGEPMAWSSADGAGMAVTGLAGAAGVAGGAGASDPLAG